MDLLLRRRMMMQPRGPILPAMDGRMWCYYYAETDNESVALYYAASAFTAGMIVDGGAEITKASPYTFAVAGMHSVTFGIYTNSLVANTFRGVAKMWEAYVPAQITAVPNNLFLDCSNLRFVVMRGTTPPTVTASAFTRTYADLKIYVPYSADHSVLAAYQTAWATYASKLHELNQDGTIPDNS